MTHRPMFAADEFDVLRARRFEMLAGGVIDARRGEFAVALRRVSDRADEQLARLDMSDGRSLVWPDLPLFDGARLREANVGVTILRLLDVACAWATTGTRQHGDDGVRDVIVDAVRFVCERGYNLTIEKTGNWWWWEIGNPMRLASILVLLYDHLSADELKRYLAIIERFVPDPNYGRGGVSETGANRTDKVLAGAVRGILAKDGAVVAQARDALSDVAGKGRHSIFAYVTERDGFYADGSFIQHVALPYAGAYGVEAVRSTAETLALLFGSSWQITDPNQGVITDSIAKTFAPFVYRDRLMDTVRGRTLSRRGRNNLHALIDSTLLLALSGQGEVRDQLQRQAVAWLADSPASLTEVGVAQLSRALAVLDAGVPAAPELTGNLHFADQDRTVHRTPGWSFTVSTSSDRIGRYEWGNRENALGWYHGDGMAYLYTDSDSEQFNGSFWPTSNPYRLPGTTVTTAPRQSNIDGPFGLPRAFRPWGGGASAGDVGTIGMDHLNYDQTLSGRLSWLCLPDAVVCLGAGIASTSQYSVESIAEHRRLSGDGLARFQVEGASAVPAIGDTAELSGATWAHLDGVGGYLFLSGSSALRVLRESRSGTWRNINDGGDTGGEDTVLTSTYLTLWYDHGIRPEDASYAYLLLPTATPGETRDRAAQPGVEVIANTQTAQGIRVPQAQLTMINFFAAGSAGGVSVTGPCAVIVRRIREKTQITVSDPSRTTDRVQVSIARQPAASVISATPGMRVVSTRPLVIEAPTGGSRGHDHTITLKH